MHLVHRQTARQTLDIRTLSEGLLLAPVCPRFVVMVTFGGLGRGGRVGMGLLDKSTFPVILTLLAEFDLSKLHSTPHPSYTEHQNDLWQVQHSDRQATSCDNQVLDTGYQVE